MREVKLLRWLAALQVASAIALTVTSLQLWFDVVPSPKFMDLRVALLPLQVLILAVCIVVGGLIFRQNQSKCASVEARLVALSGAFLDHIEQRLSEWGLTPAEHDVALFTIKGFSLSEIAGLRATSQGTVKAQTAAVYRKAGVTGRPQLLSLFIEDMLGGEMRQPNIEPHHVENASIYVGKAASAR